MTQPTVGRDVHFVHQGVHYAAKVVWVWSSTCVNLFVFPNGVTSLPCGNPGAVLEGLGYLRTSVLYAEPREDVSPLGDSWHWPERVPDRTDHEIAVAAAREAGL